MSLTALTLTVSALLAAALSASPFTLQNDDAVLAGRDIYVQECASCHGEAANGYGPRSWDLRQRPPDLSRFTTRTVPFPREELRRHITGHVRFQPSHGGSEMPYWGTSLDAPSALPSVTKMDALLDFINSIQASEFGPYKGPSTQTIAAAGKPLFERYCAGCHGKDGRGPTPTVYTLGKATDLTAIASRNSGVFEFRSVYESIARCGDRSFKAAGWSDYVTTKNIESLATYIASLQR